MDQPRPELIPNPAVRRLSLYLRQLEAFKRNSRTTVSSKQLGESLGLTDAQVDAVAGELDLDDMQGLLALALGLAVDAEADDPKPPATPPGSTPATPYPGTGSSANSAGATGGAPA